MVDSLAEYNRRLSLRQKAMDNCRRKIRAVGYARLAVGAVIAVTTWISFVLHWFSAWYVLPIVLLFLYLLTYHERLYLEGRRAQRAVAFYERGIARIEDRWIGLGNSDASFADAATGVKIANANATRSKASPSPV